MIKGAAFFVTLILSLILVDEIRTSRSLSCFGCLNVKCVIRTIDENPALLLKHPIEVARETAEMKDWLD